MSKQTMETDVINQLSIMEKCLNHSHTKQSNKFDKLFIKNYTTIYRSKKELSEKDDLISEKLLEFKDITLRHLQVKKQFRIGEHPFESSVEIFKKVSTMHTIEEKIDVIASVIADISKSVSDHYKSIDHGYSEEDLIVGADDLLPIFTYIIIKSQVQYLYSTLQIIIEISSEEIYIGEGGYCVATLETSLSTILTLNWDNLIQNFRTDGQKKTVLCILNLSEESEHFFNFNDYLIPELLGNRVKVRYVTSSNENMIQKRLNLEIVQKTITEDWYTPLKDIDELLLFPPYPNDLIEQLISSSARKVIVVDYLGLDFQPIEKSLIKSGMDYLIIKTSPCFDLFLKSISFKSDELECSLGNLGEEGKLSWIDSNDLQESILKIFLQKERGSKIITLTGEQTYSLKQIEKMTFEATGCTRIKYVQNEKRISTLLNIYKNKTQETNDVVKKYLENQNLKTFFDWIKENVENFIFIPDLMIKMRHPTKGLMLKSRTIKLVKYTGIFKASDAMNWILENFKFITTRSKARDICEKMLQEKLIDPITKTKRIFDDCFYKFSKLKKIVIVGAGIAGIQLVSKLESNFDVTLISSSEFFLNYPSLPVYAIDPTHETKTICDLSKISQKSKIIIGKVKYLTETKVKLQDGTEITRFDYLILCTGSKYDTSKFNIVDDSNLINSMSFDDIQKNHQNIEKSKSICIIGSGPTATEILGELSTKYPKKEYSIISRSENALQKYPKAQIEFDKNFNKHKYYFNENVISINGREIKTDNNLILDFDLIFLCTGFTPNTEYLLNSTMKHNLNEKNFINVNEFLQLENHSTIFACGDIIETKEEKLAQLANAHADNVITNIKRLESRLSLLKYVPNFQPALFVSLGKNKAILLQGNNVLTGFNGGYLLSAIKGVIDLKMIKMYE
eukprot:gene8928-877_t